MTPDEVDTELGRLLDEHLKKRSIGVHELVTQAFAVGCKYRAGIEEKNPESTALRAALTALRDELQRHHAGRTVDADNTARRLDAILAGNAPAGVASCGQEHPPGMRCRRCVDAPAVVEAAPVASERGYGISIEKLAAAEKRAETAKALLPGATKEST